MTSFGKFLSGYVFYSEFSVTTVGSHGSYYQDQLI